MSTFGSTVRNPEWDKEERIGKERARQMDIGALHKAVSALAEKVAELDQKLNERDATITMLMQKVDRIEQERIAQRVSTISSGPSVQPDA